MRLFSTLLAVLVYQFLSGQTSSPTPIVLSPFVPEVHTQKFILANRPIEVTEKTFGGTKQWVFVHLHGTEPTSLQAALELLPLTGGHLIKLENRNARNLVIVHQRRKWQIDPNRIYSDTGIRMNLRELNKYKAPDEVADQIRGLGAKITALIPDTTSCIIALHNNSEDNFTIRDYLPGGKRAKDARQVFVDEQQDPDDIVLTTDSLLYAHMSAACFNTIWQDPDKVKRDGSLSVYAALRGKRYVNIETQHGRQEQYLRMLQHLMYFLVREQESDVVPIKTAENERTR